MIITEQQKKRKELYGVVPCCSLPVVSSTQPQLFFLIEAIYEGMYNTTEETVRHQAYQAVLSGASGHLMGNYPVWDFSAGWSNALNSAGARSMKHIAGVFTPRAWWTLLPDTANTTLTAGASSGADRAVAARASDGAFAIAYMPSIRSITMDLSKLAGPKVKAQWIDPASGAATTVSGSPFPAFGTQSMRPAGGNSSGYGDWVLVLESTP